MIDQNRASSVPTAAPPGFLVTLTSDINRPVHRRADPSFLASNGTVTSNCHLSTTYSLTAGNQLSATDGSIFSTSPDIKYQPFVTNNTTGSISTTWQLFGNYLIWKNNAFQNGTASLCVDSTSKTIYVYFADPVPESCTPVYLTTLPGEYNLCLYIVAPLRQA